MEESEKKQLFAEVGRQGGLASAKASTPEQRKQRARNAALARWAKKRAEDETTKGDAE